ncbi:hypothetical protein [Deinococcus sp. QL22]|uniref:hypothetical protein n=1 Tax=Deinococcus sp. QL22 TaxID=2939437 RepID=UPI0020180D48|nr:hypothetical protein [Deinococcus sp. QL22]UQN06806.1 hypothetical protein M1R55_02460 [Deinococcus sp. QL22]
MANWKMYLDDSATHGAVIDENFKLRKVNNINGGVPITSAGGILVDESAERAIKRDVQRLREHIQRELRLPEPPELHMSEMWGNQLPVNSPYLKVDRKKILHWVRLGYDIIFKHGQAGSLRVIGVSLELPQVQEVLKSYCEDANTIAEREILKEYFPKATKTFYGIMLNPLIRMIMNLIVVGDDFASSNGHRLKVYYDTSEASKGFAFSEGMSIFQDLRRFESVDSIGESSPHINNLMQLADLAAYRVFRAKMIRYRVEHNMRHATDPGMVLALRDRPFDSLGLHIPNTKLRMESVHESLFAMLQIAYASQSVRQLYPESASKLLIQLNQYIVDKDEYGSLTGFFPLFSHEIREAWCNGKRPLI